MKIKICGMRQPENIADAARLEPDFIGFIFYDKSPRFVSGDLPDTDDSIIRTGVFVDASETEIRNCVKKHRLTAVQFHGNESVDALEKFSDLIRIKAFAVDENFDFGTTKIYESVTDYFLFDTKAAAAGGNGISFNWELLKNATISKPYFLSGGIGPEDASKIMASGLSPFGLDLNSRFEISAGIKNIDAIQQFKNQLQCLL